MLVLVLNLLALCLLFLSFRQEEALKKLGDQPEVQNYISISKTCKIKKTDTALTPREAVERACSKKTV